MKKPSTLLIITITSIFSEENVFNYSITHSAYKKNHSITIEIKDSDRHDHTQAIEKLHSWAEIFEYRCLAVEPTTKKTKKFTLIYKTYMQKTLAFWRQSKLDSLQGI